MALSIKNAHTERLARELAALTGQSITEAVTHALEAQLRREGGRGAKLDRAEIRSIQQVVREMVVEDETPIEQIRDDIWADT